jgi:hypothetical protein
MERRRRKIVWREIEMRTQKKTVLSNICLEKCKDGIIFLDENLPLFVKSENVAKHLQIEIWLNMPISKPKGYIV